MKVTAPFPGFKLDLGGGWGLDYGRVPARPSATKGMPGLSALSLRLGLPGGDTCSEDRRARVGSPVGASVGSLSMTSKRARGSP